MKNNKGQALVEFILIIPVFMFILLALIDVGNIIYSKYKLENSLNIIVELYQSNQTDKLSNYVTDNNLSVNYKENGTYMTILLNSKVDIMTPGLNNILGKNMNIETSRVIYSE